MAEGSRLKVRRLLAVVAVLGVLLVGSIGTYAVRARRVVANYRKMRVAGMAADAAGDRPRAVDLLGSYLARYPDDLPALLAYAKDRPLVPEANDGQLAQTVQVLRHALYIDPTLTDQRRALLDLYVRVGRLAETLDTADVILARDPHDAAALSAKTMALVRLHRLPQALDSDVAWCDAAPASAEPRLVRIDLLHELQHPKAEALALAEQWAKQWRTGTPGAAAAGEDGTADLFRAEALLQYGDVPAGVAALTDAANHAVVRPPPKTAGLAVLRDLDGARQTELARSVAQALFQAAPDDLSLRTDLALRDWELYRFADVVDLLGRVPDPAAVSSSMLGVEAVAATMANRPALAEPIRRALVRRADDLSAAWATVVAQVAGGQFDAAAVVTACRPVLDRRDDPLLRYFLGDAFARLGERDLAARQWERVVADAPSWSDPATRLCLLLTDLGRPQAALDAGREAVRRNPHSGDAAVAMAAAWVSTIQAGQDRDTAGCLALVEELAKLLPADGRVPPIHAALLVAIGRPADAAELIRATLAAAQTYPSDTWQRLAALSQANGLKVEAACLDREQKDHGLSPAVAYERAVALFAAGHPADGLRSFDAAAADPRATADRLPWALDRATYLDLIRDAAAPAAWASLCDAHAGDANVQQLALNANCVRADRLAMAKAIARLAAVSGKQGTTYELARARWLLTWPTTPDDATEVRTLLDDALHQVPESVDARILSARAYEAAGRPNEAIAEWRIAADLMPTAAGIRLNLARLLQAQGEFDAAREQLAQLTGDQLAGTEQRRQAAVLLAQAGQSDRAIELLADDAGVGAGSTTAQLTLAGLYRRQGQVARADEVVRRLMADHPDAAVIEFGADLMAATHRVPEAKALLERLSDPRTAGTANGVAELVRADFALRYGPAVAGMGDPLVLFAAATQAGPTNPTTWRARTAAELLTGHGDAALAIAADGLKHVPGDPTLQACRDESAALVLAAGRPELRPFIVPFLRQPDAKSAARATLDALCDADQTRQPLPRLATRLRELTDQFPRFLPLHLYLIGLDEQLGRHDDAAAAAARAAESVPNDPDPLRLESAALAELGRWDELLGVDTRWRDRFPTDAFAADTAAADALIHLDRPGEAIARLQPYIDHPGRDTDSLVLPLLTRARQATGQTDSATLMAPLLSKGASGRTSWMRYAVTSLPPAEADEWVRRAVAAMPADAAGEHATAARGYLQLAARTTGAESDRFAAESLDVLRPALAVPSPEPDVLLAAAAAQERAHDPAAAVDLYRRVLTVPPGSGPAEASPAARGLAQNNLAMLLAQSGHAADAVSIIAAAVTAYPNSAPLHDTQAFVLAKAGQPDPANAAAAEAVRLDPGNVAYRVRQLTLLADAGRTREAADALRALDDLHLDPREMPAETLRQLQAIRTRLTPPTAAATN